MTRWLDLDASQIEAISAKNRGSHVKASGPKIDLRPMCREMLVRDYGEAAGQSFDAAQLTDAEVAVKFAQIDSGKPYKGPKKVRAPKKAKVSIPTEHQEQKAVIEWFDSFGPTKGLDPRLLFAIPNGSNKSIPAAVKFKAEGLRSGVPDLMLAIQAGDFAISLPPRGHILYAGLFIEMKRRDGKARPEQMEFMAMLTKRGYCCVVARGADEAIRAIMSYIG